MQRLRQWWTPWLRRTAQRRSSTPRRRQRSAACRQDLKTAEQRTAAAAANDMGVSGPDQEQLAGAGDQSAASCAEEHSSGSPSAHADEDNGTILPASVGDEQPPAADSDLNTVLSLLLPGLAADSSASSDGSVTGPKDTVDTGSSPEVELAAPPAFAMLASACASAASWLDPSPAAETAEVLRQGSQTSAAPKEQQAQLKAFLCNLI